MIKEYKLYKGKIFIRFEGEGEKHKFYDDKGNDILSVSKIAGVIDKSPGLMGWVAKMMGLYLLGEKDKGNDKITEELIIRAKKEYRVAQQKAKDVGREIHEWIHQKISGNNPEMPEDEQVVNGITAYLKFQKEHKVKWIETERCVYSRKYKFGGFLDGIGIMGKELILPDFKSSNGFYPDMEIQLAGYDIAYTEETGKKPQRYFILRFGKDTGEFEIKEIKEKEMEKNREAFIGLIPTARRLKELKKEYSNGKYNS